jgi:protein SCO1/2
LKENNAKIHLLKSLAPIFMLFLLLLTGACDSQQPTSDKTKAIVSLTFQGKGKVKAINLEKQKITLDHEEIKGYMEAMTMEFSVEPKDLLNNVKVGDKVSFTLKHEAGIDTVTQLQIVP